MNDDMKRAHHFNSEHTEEQRFGDESVADKADWARWIDKGYTRDRFRDDTYDSGTYDGGTYDDDWEDETAMNDGEGEEAIWTLLHRAGYAFQTAVVDLTDAAMHLVAEAGSARSSALYQRYKQDLYESLHLVKAVAARQWRWHQMLQPLGGDSVMRSRRRSTRPQPVARRRKRGRKALSRRMTRRRVRR